MTKDYNIFQYESGKRGMNMLELKYEEIENNREKISRYFEFI